MTRDKRESIRVQNYILQGNGGNERKIKYTGSDLNSPLASVKKSWQVRTHKVNRKDTVP